MSHADPTSQANFLQVTSQHISLEWHLDFENDIIAGSVVHDLRVKEDGVKEVILDTADLTIESAEVQGKVVSYDLKEKHPVMGSALHVPLPDGLKSGSSITIKVVYKTTKDGTALQWLTKEQTQGKEFPFLFSQCQPIFARALAPIQDSPSAKITYDANVTSKLPALLSAVRVSPLADGPPHDGKVIGKDLVTYSYRQVFPIPTYLLAIAAGNLRYRALPKPEGKEWTTGVWAEPELIDDAYWEFSEDTGKFLDKEEQVVTPYKFGVYDLLVLPPSFPFGGMENACLSFLTPSLITKDRTLVDVVIHELTHSWFGNNITQANSAHFWLNEGWTTYMERLLLEKIHSPAERGFSYLIGAKGLFNALKFYHDKPKYQRLVIDFEIGEDPDDAYSQVPYEKGSNFLLHIERTLGGLEVFEPYIKDYVNTFTKQSITTNQWKSHLFSYFEKYGGEDKIKALNTIDWDAWLYGEGTSLPVEMTYDTSLAKKAYALAERWDASRSAPDLSQLDFKESDMDDFNSNQKVVLLERLQSYSPLPASHVSLLGTLYKFSTTSNAEIRYRFYEVALQDPSSPNAKSVAEDAAKWVVGEDGSDIVQGRMKFCRPVFRATSNVSKDLAIATFQRNKSAFHPIAQKQLAKDLGLA